MIRRPRTALSTALSTALTSAAATTALALLLGVPASAGTTPEEASLQTPSQTPQTTQSSVAELQEQLRQLQQKVQQLESQQTQQQQELNAKVTTETVERVLRDSDQRSRFLQFDTGFNVGWVNDKFTIGSADGSWTLIPGLLMQFRNVTNYAMDADGGDEEFENGFEVRRAKLMMDGTAVTRELFYHFQWNSGTNGGNTSLEDALVRYTFNTEQGLQVKLGQYKDPWAKEEITGDHRQLAVERSLLNSLIGGGITQRVQGVSLIQEADRYRAEVMYHDGANSLNTNFQDGGGPATFLGAAGDNYGVSGRFDFFFSEKNKQIDDFTAYGNKTDLLVLGGGLDWTQGGDSDAIFHEINLQWETAGGLSMFASYNGVWRDLGTGAGGGAPPAGEFYDWGLLGQIGYVIPDTKWEIYGRYDVTFLDDEALPAGAEDTLHEVNVGANYYFYKHNVKFTIEGCWLPNGVPTDFGGLDYIASDDNQFVLRTQFQLYL